ncbi:somatotropin [Pelobates cultripes]|uniref:Somatotropin n=1 Tax=Pelobates cultripes TaxID=61616 RepID=A0AAD1WFW3_PELCU|nr:somatotropin [Pelobates cultripes]
MDSGFFSPLVFLVILSIQNHFHVRAFPSVPLSNLITNAVNRAQDLHLLAADTYRDYERTYIPEDQRHSNKNSRAVYCYSESIRAPSDKDNTHQKSDMELLRFSLTLIQSWLNPVQVLNRVFTNNLVFGNADNTVYEKLRDMEEGILALIREMEEGNARSYDLMRLTYDKFDINQRSDNALVKNYGLLSCFKKDMHKVETYLRVMKCRRFVESNCAI